MASMSFPGKVLDAAVASRVVKATAAAAEAVARCNAARHRATGAVAGGNGVAAREAAGSCADASLAALEAATRCEAVAEEAGASYRPAATMAAREARGAAARCDVEGGAPAASREANDCADSCVAACGDAEVLSVAAREAAARCVLARDDAGTAALVMVARKATTEVDAHRKAYRESDAAHQKARKDAAAAALAAREAAVRCAASSRRAVAAASVAREAASRCDVAGGDGSAAAAAARQAADRCVAALLLASADAAADRANAAASEAREAAASCDAALTDPVADADKEFSDKTRGWLMTVAALLVGIAFQAIVRPPVGMSFDHCTLSIFCPGSIPPPSRRGPDNAWSGSCLYLFSTTATMAVALTMLVLLLTMKRSTSRFTLFFSYRRIALFYIKGMLASLALGVAASFVIGTSANEGVQLTTLVFFLVYPIAASMVRIILFYV